MHNRDDGRYEQTIPRSFPAPYFKQTALAGCNMESYEEIEMRNEDVYEVTDPSAWTPAKKDEVEELPAKHGRGGLLITLTTLFAVILLGAITAIILLYFHQQSEWEKVTDDLTEENFNLSLTMVEMKEQMMEMKKAYEGGHTEMREQIMEMKKANEDAQGNAERRILQLETKSEELHVNQMDQAQNDSEFSISLANAEYQIVQLQNELEGYCPVKYNGKCFWVAPRFSPSINFTAATEICAGLGGKPANIYSEEHYNMMMEYVRTFTTKDDWMTAWFGMTYDRWANTTFLSDGSRAPFVKWYFGDPACYDRCNIVLWVEMDWRNKYQHMLTWLPTSTTKGVICEK